MAGTPNYALNLPVVGADLDAWGDETNANWSSIDTIIKTNETAAATAQAAAVAAQTTADAASTNANTRVLKAGDTMTGPLELPAVDPFDANAAVRRQYVIDGMLSFLSRYTFNTSVAAADPGSGKISFNGATPNVATILYVSATKADGSAFQFVNLVTNFVISVSDGSKTVFFKVIAGSVNNTTYYAYNVQYITSSAAAIANNAVVLLAVIAPSYAPPVAAYTDYDLGAVPSSSTRVSQAHGLSAIPSNFRALFKCTTTNGGYAVGDYIPITSIETTTGNSDNGTQCFASGFNATEVWLSVNSAGTPGFTAKGGSTTPMASVFTPGSWHVIFRVWP
jgi:hypothetical protein